MGTTTIRAIEAFLAVFASAFLSQIAVTGQPIDITNRASQSSIVTAAIAAFGIAFRQWSVTRK